MNRREFIVGLGSAAAWPFVAQGQQRALPAIGMLHSGSPETSARFVTAFHRGLGEVGYTEEQNVVIEYRWAYGDYDRVPALAADLVRRQVAVLATIGTNEAKAAKAATTTIPIVFNIAADPIEMGLVKSLSRPDGNITGVTMLGVEIGAKKLEFLRQIVPKTTIITLLLNPSNANSENQFRDLQVAARTLGVELNVMHASTERDLDTSFSDLAKMRSGGLVIGTDPFFTGHSQLIAALTLRFAIPAIYQTREFVASGGLMSYGASFPEAYRLAGSYTGRILKGERPANLPVQQATKVELVINMKTAEALGLTIPLPLLGRADEVIE